MAKPPLKDAGETGRRMMFMSLLILATGIFAAYLSYTGAINLGNPVDLAISVNQPMPIDALRPTADLDVTVKLQNNENKVLTLTAPDSCSIFRWILVDPSGEFVQSGISDNCPDVRITRFVEAKQSLEETYPLPLDTRRVKPGDYALLIRYWGYEDRVKLTLK
ncbi:MAG: hypothetical protein PW790_12345 [Parvibaculaceae bacterium]|nr:hypothetical protein [Parvibaculaceae bacterium]